MDTRLFQKMIEPYLAPLKSRVMSAISRAVIEKADDSKGVQTVKILLLDEEVKEAVERVQNWGFTSNPPANSEAVAVFIGGNRELGFVIGCDERGTRLRNLQPGESGQYSATPSHRLVLKLGGKFDIGNASGDLLTQLSTLCGILAAEPFIVNKAGILAVKTILDTMKP